MVKDRGKAGYFILTANWTRGDETLAAGQAVKLTAADAEALGNQVRPATDLDSAATSLARDLTAGAAD